MIIIIISGVITAPLGILAEKYVEDSKGVISLIGIASIILGILLLNQFLF